MKPGAVVGALRDLLPIAIAALSLAVAVFALALSLCVAFIPRPTSDDLDPASDYPACCGGDMEGVYNA